MESKVVKSLKPTNKSAEKMKEKWNQNKREINYTK